jgi:hypothetical protein
MVFALRVISVIPLLTFPGAIPGRVSITDTTIPLRTQGGKVPARLLLLPERLNLVVGNIQPAISTAHAPFCAGARFLVLAAELPARRGRRRRLGM